MRFAPAAALTATILAVAALIAACPRPILIGPGTPASAMSGCGKDTDCKGSRVCEGGQCVEPHGAAAGGAKSPSGHGSTALQQPDGGPPYYPPYYPPYGGDGGMPAPITLPGASAALHGGWTHSGRSRFRVSQQTPRSLGQFATGGTIFSSPAITDDGLAIFGSHDKSLYAVALGGDKPAARWTRATGDLVWCAPALGPGGAMAPASAVAPMAAPGKAAPRDCGVAADGGAGGDGGAGSASIPVVYVGSDDDRLYALDSDSGAVRWSFVAGPCKRAIGFGPEAARCDIDGVTVGPDGTIYFVADGAYALRPDGTLKWRFALRTHCAAPPAVGEGGNVYFGCQDGRLYALGPDGSKRWEFPTKDDIDSPPAIGADGTIYFGSDDSRLYALGPTGVLRWALKTGGDVRGGPAIAEDGTIYAGSFDGNLYAVHPDGTVAWSFATADRILSSPTIDAAGVVLIGSQDDRLYAVTPDGKLLWSVLLGGDVDGTAAIGPGGIIAVGSDDKALHVFR